MSAPTDEDAKGAGHDAVAAADIPDAEDAEDAEDAARDPNAPTDLFAPLCSIATTKRRRFLWAAWWSGPPTSKPFRKPDAYAGGARTAEEALAEAERVAGRPLVLTGARWARAWGRILVGQPPWFGPERAPRTATADGEAPARDAPRTPFAILGLEPTASAEEVKRAFRKRALETHPDRGGTDEDFRVVQRAYLAATARASGTPRRRRRRA